MYFKLYKHLIFFYIFSFSDLFGSSSNSTINTTNQGQSSTNTLPSTNGSKMSSSASSNVLLSPTIKKANKQPISDQAASLFVEQSSMLTNHDQMSSNEKVSKAYDFLKEDHQKSSQPKIIVTETQKPIPKEDGRMQAYGWSLPSKATLDANKSTSSTAITVPVPVYCRPLFEQDNNLKLSCSSTVNFSFDPKVVKNCAEIIEASSFGHFKSNLSNSIDYKSSCIWICNLNDNDTHVSVLDANRPGDLIEQFVLKYLKIYCIQSIAG